MNLNITLTQGQDGSSKLDISVGGKPLVFELPIQGPKIETTFSDVAKVEATMSKKSDCCGAAVVIVDSDSGVDQIKCTKCFDLCRMVSVDGIIKIPIRHLCCGSRARRHRADCQRNEKYPLGSNSIFECEDCKHEYPDLRKKTHICPNCKGENVFAKVD